MYVHDLALMRNVSSWAGYLVYMCIQQHSISNVLPNQHQHSLSKIQSFSRIIRCYIKVQY